MNISWPPKTMIFQVEPTITVMRKVGASLILSINLFNQGISKTNRKLIHKNSLQHLQIKETREQDNRTLEQANQT